MTTQFSSRGCSSMTIPAIAESAGTLAVMISAADPAAVVWINLVAMLVFAGFTASFLCVVLERRLVGETPTGRSHCVCGAQIPMTRNIPVVSWSLQRGKARCCGARIPAWYVLSEAAFVLAAGTVAVVVWPHVLVGGAGGTAVAAVALAVWHRRHNRN